MPWKTPRPHHAWNDIEKLRYNQEAYDRAIFGTFSWTPPNVAANSTATFVASASGPDVTTNATKGLRTGNPVTVSPPSVLPTQVSVYAFVANSDQMTIAIVNPTAGTVTPPSGTWSFSGTVT